MIKQNKAMSIGGWVLAVLVAGILTMSASFKLFSPEVKDQMVKMGFTETRVMVIGILEITCVLIFLVPHTAALGAVLVTGYLGGAVATHVHGGDAPINCIIPSLFGVAAWLSLFLRDARVRSLLPFRCCAKRKIDAPVA